MSDSELIARILSGEERLFTRLVEQYSGYVWALCSSYIHNPSDCEDVTQDVFVQCYRRLDTLRNPAAFGGWLSQLARRHCLMWLRASARREERHARYRAESAAEEGTMEHAAQEDRYESIRNAIETLPSDYREALLLRFAEGYSAEEAAAFLGISPAAMRKRIERAQNMLKDRLWDQVEPALKNERHRDQLARGIVAAIPFGQARWLAVPGAGVAAGAGTAAKAALMGGVTIMSKKLAIGIGCTVLASLLALFASNQFGAPGTKVRQAAVSQPPKTPKLAEDVATTQGAATPPPLSPAKATAKEEPKPEEKPVPVPAKPASVSGRVEDNESHPIAGADVLVEVARDRYCNDVIKTYQAKTRPDGRFEIAGIDVFGPSHAYASAEGFAMARSRTAQVSGGARIKDVNFRLEPAKFYVAGRVVTDGGAAIAGASVDSLYYGYDDAGLEHTASTGQTTGNISGSKFIFGLTDSSGAFKVAVPNEGLCDFRVTKDGYSPGFFPKVETGTADARFVLKGGGTISGKVTTTEGRPVEGTTVTILGEALPGGLDLSPVRIQRLPLAPVSVTTDAHGAYLAERLGEEYIYTVTVPAPESASAKDTGDDKLRKHIVAAMRELDEDCLGATAISARKTDIRVKSGQTTSGVDLVLGSEGSGIVHGTVTDRSSGKPVCPVVVTAALVDTWGELFSFGKKPGIWFQSKAGGSAVTRTDGTYELRVSNLSKAQRFRIGYAFMTEGGSAWDLPDEEISVVELRPGAEQEVNFSVDAPVTVPVRYVGTGGDPIEGVEAALGSAGSSGGCGGTLISDAEGRVTFHGVVPNVSLQALAWRGGGGHTQTLGKSEPFTGQPGETVPELTVVCRMLGGIEVIIAFPDGRVAANTSITCEGTRADAPGAPLQGTITTDESGAIRLPDAIPEGVYSVRVTFVDGASSQTYRAGQENVEVAAGVTTNLGTLVAEPETDRANILKAADWGRKGNEAIAAAYSPDWLDAMPAEPGLDLKLGFALYDMGRYEDALSVFQKMSETLQGNDLYVAVSQIWQGQMLDLLGRRQEAVAMYTGVAGMNVSEQMQHDQFGLVYSPSAYAQQRAKEPFTRIENRTP